MLWYSVRSPAPLPRNSLVAITKFVNVADCRTPASPDLRQGGRGEPIALEYGLAGLAVALAPLSNSNHRG